MTQPIHLIGEFWAIELPAGAINIVADMGYLIFKVPNYANWCNDNILSDYGKLEKYIESHKPENDYKTGGIPLSPGNWQFICTSKECSWEQAAGIVPHHFGNQHEMLESGWQDYMVRYDKHFDSALESLKSLLQSKGCDLNANYAILKKVWFMNDFQQEIERGFLYKNASKTILLCKKWCGDIWVFYIAGNKWATLDSITEEEAKRVFEKKVPQTDLGLHLPDFDFIPVKNMSDLSLECRGPDSHCKACEDEKNGIKHIQSQKHTCKRKNK